MAIIRELVPLLTLGSATDDFSRTPLDMLDEISKRHDSKLFSRCKRKGYLNV
jgi:hypothetical protein